MSTGPWYGRRICEIENLVSGEKKLVLTGQWVGHSYGSSLGTKIQRKNVVKPHGENWVITKISVKVIWGSRAGNLVKDNKNTFGFIEPGTEIDRNNPAIRKIQFFVLYR